MTDPRRWLESNLSADPGLSRAQALLEARTPFRPLDPATAARVKQAVLHGSPPSGGGPSAGSPRGQNVLIRANRWLRYAGERVRRVGNQQVTVGQLVLGTLALSGLGGVIAASLAANADANRAPLQVAANRSPSNPIPNTVAGVHGFGERSAAEGAGAAPRASDTGTNGDVVPGSYLLANMDPIGQAGAFATGSCLDERGTGPVACRSARACDATGACNEVLFATSGRLEGLVPFTNMAGVSLDARGRQPRAALTSVGAECVDWFGFFAQRTWRREFAPEALLCEQGMLFAAVGLGRDLGAGLDSPPPAGAGDAGARRVATLSALQDSGEARRGALPSSADGYASELEQSSLQEGPGATDVAVARARSRAGLTPSKSPKRVAARSSGDPRGLREETFLLEAARSDLARNPKSALATAQEHQIQFPNGQLSSQRTLIQIEALLRLGRDSSALSLARTVRSPLYRERAVSLLKRYGALLDEAANEAVTSPPPATKDTVAKETVAKDN